MKTIDANEATLYSVANFCGGKKLAVHGVGMGTNGQKWQCLRAHLVASTCERSRIARFVSDELF